MSGGGNSLRTSEPIGWSLPNTRIILSANERTISPALGSPVTLHIQRRPRWDRMLTPDAGPI